jgi:hypothetical protein
LLSAVNEGGLLKFIFSLFSILVWFFNSFIHGILKKLKSSQTLLQHSILLSYHFSLLVFEPMISNLDLAISIDLITLSSKVIIKALKFDIVLD